MVARVISRAVHDAVLMDELSKTRVGQEAIADALLEFARVLAKYHFRGMEHLIEASTLVRHASELMRKGAIVLVFCLV